MGSLYGELESVMRVIDLDLILLFGGKIFSFNLDFGLMNEEQWAFQYSLSSSLCSKDQMKIDLECTSKFASYFTERETDCIKIQIVKFIFCNIRLPSSYVTGSSIKFMKLAKLQISKLIYLHCKENRSFCSFV